ncbi:hypothetical protein [Marivita sp.]|uniref:hypothetical protein n=1 Tax=Marivita sp. TaxID=2003365 RepID=UPI003F72C02E
MTRHIVTAVALVVSAFLSTSGASAQGLQVGPPAEYPPSGYAGRQYVDSRGCVYVRAGVDGTVNWVPRVSSNRKLICGQTPSLARQQTVTVAEAAPVIVTPQRIVRGVPNRTVQAQKYTQPKQRVRVERIVPRHVYESQGDTLPPIPKGYQPAWEDDRLNPHRAHMTREGHRATQQVWSNTVPRRLLTEGQDIREPVIVGRGKGLGH